MKDSILVITYNLNFIIKRLERLTSDDVDIEVNEKLKIINEKVYELGDLLEMIERKSLTPSPSPKERGEVKSKNRQ